MASKVRKQIYIDPDQESTLKQLAKDTGISEAEIIRQAIDHTRRSCEYPGAILALGNGSDRGFSN